MPDQKPSLYLIDGHAVIYRYFNAFKENPLRTTTGIDTGACWGMAKIVVTLLRNYPLTHIGVIFDPPYRTWRKDFYSGYKANRTHKDDISPQLDMASAMLSTWGIYSAAFRPLEADDVIAILTEQAVSAGMDVVLVTRDKDFAQLVGPSVRLLDLGRTVGKDEAHFIDEAGVQAKFGVRPDQIVDYLTLLGDTSDNIPGVDGCGPDTAASLLTKYGNIDSVYKNLSELTKAKKANFERAKVLDPETNMAPIDRDRVLVKFATQYQLNISLDELKRPALHNLKLFELFEKLEFYQIIKELAE